MNSLTIHKILIANRGEIARRIIRTCHALGISTVAVFSDADRDADFVREADEAVRIGPAPSAESYLLQEKIIEAAKLTKSDAIHPGYGFLAENASFAAQCEASDLIFIGPTAAVLRAVGSKKEAKRIAKEADVPVIPGYTGREADLDTLQAQAEQIGYPLLLKANAGGGGKGMRVVREATDLPEAFASATREAESAFGDGTMLVEKYIERPRHVEVQILGDAHGNVLHLFERECSIQRRHQKIVEEHPSPALDDDLRQRMCEAAVRVGKAIGYKNAGTVEFMLAPDRSFYFLEVNARLQVEHPVTEQITGLDLVREQISVARNEPLRFLQEDIRREGAALETRLYAEDPANDFLPAIGTILDWHVEAMPGLRVDTGIETNSEVTIHYDPMLAKVITHGVDRQEARSKMLRALSTLSVQGIVTNRSFLLQVLRHPEYQAGNFDTHFIETHLAERRGEAVEASVVENAAIAAALWSNHQRKKEAGLSEIASGYRNNRFEDQQVLYQGPDGEVRVSYRDLGDRYSVTIGTSEWEVALLESAERVVFMRDQQRVSVRVVVDGPRFFTHTLQGSVLLTEQPRFPDRSIEAVRGGCVAPMPGKIVQVRVENGQQVEAGQVLVVMEAMKMEHSVLAPQDGVASQVNIAVGEQVDGGQLLVVVKD